MMPTVQWARAAEYIAAGCAGYEAGGPGAVAEPVAGVSAGGEAGVAIRAVQPGYAPAPATGIYGRPAGAAGGGDEVEAADSDADAERADGDERRWVRLHERLCRVDQDPVAAERGRRCAADGTGCSRQQWSWPRHRRAPDTALDARDALSRNYLAGLPGRKNLIWFSGSFPPIAIMSDDEVSDPTMAAAASNPNLLTNPTNDPFEWTVGAMHERVPGDDRRWLSRGARWRSIR